MQEIEEGKYIQEWERKKIIVGRVLNREENTVCFTRFDIVNIVNKLCTLVIVCYLLKYIVI